MPLSTFRVPARRAQRLHGGVAASAFLACLLIGMDAQPSLAGADIYQYTDKDGVISFTDAPTRRHVRKVDLDQPLFRPRLSLHEVEPTINRHAEQHQLDPALLRAVIKVESDFDPSAVSRAGAVGLMQLMPSTAQDRHVVNPYDPEQNIGGGAMHLRYLLNRFGGNLHLALAAYNAGEHRIGEKGTIPNIQETQHYVKRVMGLYRQYSQADRIALPRRVPATLASSRRPSP